MDKIGTKWDKTKMFRKLILKSPKFVLLGANLVKFQAQCDIHGDYIHHTVATSAREAAKFLTYETF